MLQKLVWSGLFSGLGALAALASQRASAAIWRIATGEEPPEERG